MVFVGFEEAILNLNTLREQFDRVTLKHCINLEEPKTIAILAKGDYRYVGISYCHANDQFSRKRGREIALSRALHRFQVENGDKLERNFDNYVATPLENSPNSIIFNIKDIPVEVTSSIPEHLYLPKTEEQGV